MATVEIEVKDDGSFGEFPKELQKFLDKRIDEAYQKGADKAETRLKTLIVDPKELETLRTKAKDLEDIQLQIAERDKNYEEAQKIRDKRHAEELEAERKALTKTRNKFRELAGKTIRAAAVEAGARAESLDELERLIGAEMDFDDSLEPFIKDAEGKPLEKDGTRVTVEGYVREYLDKKPHHKAGTPAKGGKAPGGAAMRGTPAAQPGSKDALAEAMDIRDPKSIDRYIGAIVKRSA